ncbi:MAG: imidazoleglycerol-phosphate dehydratase HisB [Selenomonadales bacterium]|nr:imidazoleglycerol-phosphate dehydratase HisB [Selenomonadales bacterium]
MRTASVTRQTAETDIRLSLNLDGIGKSDIKSGVGFFDHMLTLFAKHGGFDLAVECRGDIEVDGHHTVEDIGIVLGQAFAQCTADKKGMARYGSWLLPMDETLIMAAVDISGRPFLVYDAPVDAPMIGAYDTELTEEFLRAFVVHAGITLHVKKMHGKNAHHIVEGIFKALGRVMRQATRIDASIQGVLSTKGSL